MAKRTSAAPRPQKASFRTAFQKVLQTRVKSLAEMTDLADSLGVSTSLVKKMAYNGEGGLDAWSQAFEYLFKWEERNFRQLVSEIAKQNPMTPADEIWLSLRLELNATEDEMLYLASCAKAALEIQRRGSPAVKKRKK